MLSIVESFARRENYVLSTPVSHVEVKVLRPDDKHPYLGFLVKAEQRGIESTALAVPIKRESIQRRYCAKERLAFYDSLPGSKRITSKADLQTFRQYQIFELPNLYFLVANVKKNATFWYARTDACVEPFKLFGLTKIEAENEGAGSIYHLPGWQQHVRNLLELTGDELTHLSTVPNRCWPQLNLSLYSVRHP